MTNQNNIPKELINECSKLQEYTIFILPINIESIANEFSNSKKLLTYHLSKIFKRHKKNLNTTLVTFDIATNKIIYNDVNIDISKIYSIITNILKDNPYLLIIINNYKFKYGYLIIKK